MSDIQSDYNFYILGKLGFPKLLIFAKFQNIIGFFKVSTECSFKNSTHYPELMNTDVLMDYALMGPHNITNLAL